MLSAGPFSVIVDTAPESMQLERIELQPSEIPKSKHRESGFLEVYGAIDISSYPMLRRQAMKLISLSGSTYICEQSFSVMSHNKSHLRLRIQDSNLENVLRVATTNREPQMWKLVSQKHFNERH